MTIHREQAPLQRVVFELRYRFGFTYLDVCGHTINTIQKTSPEWILRSDSPNPQAASLVSLRNGCMLNLSSLKLDLSLEKPIGDGTISDEDFKSFMEQTNETSAIIIDLLGLNDFSRIGFRAWYLFEKDSREQSEKWLLNLGLYSFSDFFKKKFAGDLESAGVAVVVVGTDAKYRIAFNAVERQAQFDFGQGLLNIPARSLHKDQHEHLQRQIEVKKRMRQNPEFAVMIDVDCFVDDPEVVEPINFIRKNVEEYTRVLESIPDNMRR